MRAQPGAVLFRIADHALVWAVIDAAERDLGAVTVGQPATVKARGFPAAHSPARSTSLYPEINKETRTARLRIELTNPDLVLLHGMYVDAEIKIGTPTRC